MAFGIDFHSWLMEFLFLRRVSLEGMSCEIGLDARQRMIQKSLSLFPRGRIGILHQRVLGDILLQEKLIEFEMRTIPLFVYLARAAHPKQGLEDIFELYQPPYLLVNGGAVDRFLYAFTVTGYFTHFLNYVISCDSNHS